MSTLINSFLESKLGKLFEEWFKISNMGFSFIKQLMMSIIPFSLRKRTLLLEEGKRGKSLFVVLLEGCVEVRKNSVIKRDKREYEKEAGRRKSRKSECFFQTSIQYEICFNRLSFIDGEWIKVTEPVTESSSLDSSHEEKLDVDESSMELGKLLRTIKESIFLSPMISSSTSLYTIIAKTDLSGFYITDQQIYMVLYNSYFSTNAPLINIFCKTMLKNDPKIQKDHDLCLDLIFIGSRKKMNRGPIFSFSKKNNKSAFLVVSGEFSLSFDLKNRKTGVKRTEKDSTNQKLLRFKRGDVWRPIKRIFTEEIESARIECESSKGDLIVFPKSIFTLFQDLFDQDSKNKKTERINFIEQLIAQRQRRRMIEKQSRDQRENFLNQKDQGEQHSKIFLMKVGNLKCAHSLKVAISNNLKVHRKKKKNEVEISDLNKILNESKKNEKGKIDKTGVGSLRRDPSDYSLNLKNLTQRRKDFYRDRGTSRNSESCFVIKSCFNRSVTSR